MNFIPHDKVITDLKNMSDAQIESTILSTKSCIGIMEQLQVDFDKLRFDGCINRVNAFLNLVRDESDKRQEKTR